MLDLKGIEPNRFESVKKPKVVQKYNVRTVSWEDNYNKLSDWSKNRVRFHMHNRDLMDVGDPTVNICYSLYRQSLINSGNGELIQRYKLDSVMTDLQQARALSEYIKKKGPSETVKWRYLVDLHRLHDFLPYMEENMFYDDIVDWVQRKPLHTWNGDEDLWYNIFEDECRKLLFSRGKRPERIVTVDEFIMNGDLWCTSGSGFEPEAESVKVFDKRRDAMVDTKKNKWSVRWASDNQLLRKLLFKKRKQICKAVQKSEPGKVRAVISSDMSLYLKMSYVSTFLDRLLKGRTDSTLWMSAEDRFQLWQKMAPDGTWRMPLDQSEFDKNVHIRQIIAMNKVIRELLVHFSAPADVLEVMDLVIYALDGGYVFVDGKSVPITNGVLSGWRWTAMYDTIVNLVELAMAKRWVQENSTITVQIDDFNAQGDDDWLKLKNRKSAIAIWLAYESFGLFVNPGKFFLDTSRDEYLRRVMDRGILTGYPARSITGICFRNPVSEKETVGSDRIRQTLGKWKLLCERLDYGFEDSWFMNQWLMDSVQGTKGVSKEQLRGWLYQSAWVGGLGWNQPPVDESLVPSSSVLEYNPMVIEGIGYDQWSEFASTYGVTSSSANTFAVSTLEIPPSKLASWVKYIISYDHFETSVEVGLEWDRPGSIAVGKKTYDRARAKRIRWFPSLAAAKTSSHYSYWEWELPPYVEADFKISHLSQTQRGYRLTTVPGISVTLAQLSDKPELVWEDYVESKFHGKPKSWTKDFLAGRLKKVMSLRPGWGSDITGHISSQVMNSAIIIYLQLAHPTLKHWRSLLASIDAAVPRYLALLPLRVVE